MYAGGVEVVDQCHHFIDAANGAIGCRVLPSAFEIVRYSAPLAVRHGDQAESRSQHQSDNPHDAIGCGGTSRQSRQRQFDTRLPARTQRAVRSIAAAAEPPTTVVKVTARVWVQ